MIKKRPQERLGFTSLISKLRKLRSQSPRSSPNKRHSFLRKSKPQVYAVPVVTGSDRPQSQKSPVIPEPTIKLQARSDSKEGEALIRAAENGRTAVVRSLILQYDLNDEPVKMDSLRVAAKGGHTAIISLFLERKFVDPRQKYCYYKTTPLHEVVKFGNEASVQTVLDAGPDIGAICAPGRSALHEAAAYGNAGAVRLLVKSHAPLSAMSWKGKTALHLAAEHGHLDVVKILLESGVGTDEKSAKGLTALHLATQNGYLEVVNLLLERKAHVNGADYEGQTPQDYAVNAGNQELALLLNKNGGNPSPENSGKPSPENRTPGRGFSAFDFDGKNFTFDGDTGLKPVRKKTSDGQHVATGSAYEPE